ncbi:hypothetical protein J2S74_002878 [Evansella vedderi]|uniref:Uncharacterized protein n=1 Tax=Evansella vedderi TaxID=38282 RepID=A0ABT9ZW91_9BACI|nr:hypothetical protein [Evansella vedderi]
MDDKFRKTLIKEEKLHIYNDLSSLKNKIPDDLYQEVLNKVEELEEYSTKEFLDI